MLVKELIEALKKCDQNAPVCWDSHGMDYWYGGSVGQEQCTREQALENCEEPENVEGNFPMDMKNHVILQ